MSNSITPITEDDIANFLVNTPDFLSATHSCCPVCGLSVRMASEL